MKSLFDIIKFISTHPLAKKHKAKAFYKFFKWQIIQSISPRLMIYPFVEKTKLFVKKGMSGATGNIYVGLHEFYEMSFLLHFLRSKDTFVDVGANVGSYTILASGVIGSKTICLEPAPETFALLQKNILLNKLNSIVTPLNLAVGSADGSVNFTNDLDTINHVLLDQEITNSNAHNSNLINVQVKTLDKILEKENLVSLIKIDVEGFEQEVIKGAANTLKNDNLKVVLIEFGSGKNFNFDEESIHDELLKCNFLPYEYLPFQRLLKPIPNFGNGNRIYIRDFDFVKERIVNGKSITIFSEKF